MLHPLHAFVFIWILYPREYPIFLTFYSFYSFCSFPCAFLPKVSLTLLSLCLSLAGACRFGNFGAWIFGK